jgi:hypothetical protein
MAICGAMMVPLQMITYRWMERCMDMIKLYGQEDSCIFAAFL